MNDLFNNSNSILALVQRNLLTIIILLLLIIFAPLFFKIIAGVLLAGILLIVALPFIMMWRVKRMARRMEEQMRQGQGGFYGGFDFRQGGFGQSGSASRKTDGDVKVHVGGARDKKVSDDVGDYVDFEEIKNEKK